MSGHAGPRRARAKGAAAADPAAYIGFCPNPQSLRALMTAHHDPPGKILGDLERATSNMQRGSNLRLCRGACERAGDRGYGERGLRLFMARGLSNGTIRWISLASSLRTEYRYSNNGPL